MTDFVKQLQSALGVKPDGMAGRQTFTALFRKLGARSDRAEELALSANVHFPAYGILENADRLAHFMAQLGHAAG